MCYILKRAGRRGKRSKIWAPGVSTKYTWRRQGTFDYKVFMVSLRSFSAFLTFYDFDNLVFPKRLAIERNRPKFGPRWVKYLALYVPLR